MSSSTPRIAVIGAGPAGATSAIVLARAGCRVTLFEQHAGQRDKVCGECLSHVGIGVLDALGLSDQLAATAHPTRLRRTILYPIDGPRLNLAMPAPMWGISRWTLDEFLMQSAGRSGAQLLRPMRCERLSPADGKVTVVVRDLRTGSCSEPVFDLLILADGRSALLPDRPPPTADLGIKSHWAGITRADDAIELFGVRGHYGGVAPVDGARCNISFSVPAEKVRAARGDLDALFASIASENAHLRHRLAGARRVSAWRASPLLRFPVQAHWPSGVIPVGNAAAAIEPIGGEGMGLAMRSAQIAAEAILSNGHDHPDLGNRVRRAYQSLWRTRGIACRAIATVLSRPGVAGAALTLVEASPPLGRIAMHLAGKR